MTVRGGDVIQCTWFGRELEPKNESNVSIDLGGLDGTGAVTGGGTFFLTQKRKKAVVSDLQIVIDESTQDLEWLQRKCNAGEAGPFTLTLCSGITYQGKMALTGEVKKSLGDGVASLTFEGGKLEQI